MNPAGNPRPLLAYYGDDFTGSTDVLEALHLGGVPGVLYLEPPDPATWRRQFPAARAIGVAGVARSLPRADMAAELQPALTALAALNPRFFLYKLCSTFDSSPEVGSIGHALELVRRTFPARLLPLIVGAPALRRHVVFGNLFAGFGPEVVRLDRHPTMSRHPVTPMAEADLRRHLSRQSPVPVELVDWLTLRAGAAETRAKLAAWAGTDTERTILFDTLVEGDLEVIGCVVAELAGAEHAAAPVPLAGSSAVAHALASVWRLGGDRPSGLPAPVDRMLVVSGSASPQTAAQLDAAEAAGWAMIRMDVPRLLNPDTTTVEFERLLRSALEALASGDSVGLFSARGPDDPALAGGEEGRGGLGAAQGRLLREILARSGLRRACVAGGDTSGHAVRQLGVYALEFVAGVAPGSPLCRARSTLPAFDGIELALKGGQNGPPDYFLQLGAQPNSLLKAN